MDDGECSSSTETEESSYTPIVISTYQSDMVDMEEVGIYTPFD
jgi:hypothetical protein